MSSVKEEFADRMEGISGCNVGGTPDTSSELHSGDHPDVSSACLMSKGNYTPGRLGGLEVVILLAYTPERWYYREEWLGISSGPGNIIGYDWVIARILILVLFNTVLGIVYA